jgi:hypothetical protein
MTRFVPSLALLILMLVAAPAGAQSLGTFRWQLKTFGSVLNLNVTQQGAIYTLHGFETQCSNPTLPVWGVAVPQPNGTVLLGLTTLTETGRGLHTIATISISNGFNGTWRDNANQSGEFAFNPGNTCPGGPRISPIFPDPRDESADADARIRALEAEMAALRAQLGALAAGKQ